MNNAPSSFRREVSGVGSDGTPCTTVIEVSDDYTGIILRLAPEDLFVVTLATPDVAELAKALISGEPCYVSAVHASHGRCLLGVHPHGDDGAPLVGGSTDHGRRELHLELTDDDVCKVMLDAAQATELVRHLGDGWRLIRHPQLGE